MAAATSRSETGLLGVVRVECLADREDLPAHTRPTDFEAENLAQRLAWRTRPWMPATVAADA